MTRRAYQTLWWVAVCTLSFVLARQQAGDFAQYANAYHVLHEMNDIRFIAHGYKDVPNVFACLAQAFAGTLQQTGIQVYRPFASALTFFELRLGENYGWLAVGYFGLGLHILNCGLAILLSWRATRSWVAALTAAVTSAYAPYIGWYSKEWAVWFPCHPEMLMMAFLFGMFLCLESWLDNGRRRWLAGAFACFVSGLLTKEFFVIAPFMALAYMATHRNFRQRWKPCLAFVGGTLFITACFMLVRGHLLTTPRNAMPLKWVHFYMGKKIFLWLAHPFYLYIPDPGFNLWFPGLAILFLLLGSGIIRANQRWPQLRSRWYGLLASIFVPLGLMLFYLQFLTPEGGWGEALQWVIQSKVHPQHLLEMMATSYCFYLLVKYRKVSRSFSAFWLLVLVYVPAFTMDGWHYGMAGAILRGAFFWPVVAQLVVEDIKPYFPVFKRLAIVPGLETVEASRLSQ